MSDREKKRILVFPCGSEIGLEIYRSFKFSKDFELIGASSVADHGRFVYENYIDNVPFVDDDKFIEKINELVNKNDIDYVFAAHDSVLLKLAENKVSINATIIASPLATCAIARSKRRTYEKLEKFLRTPTVYSLNDSLEFPVFVKPDVGQGSKGARLIKSKEELRLAIKNEPDLLVMENLEGDEYTVDCFTDRRGVLRVVQPRIRNRIQNGISVNASLVKDKTITQIAARINEVLKFRGVWFFQLKKDKEDEYCLLEFAPRVSGTMSITRMNGLNLPLLSVYDFMGRDIRVIDNNLNIEVDRALDASFNINYDFKTVYVDFDDTLIIDENVNYLLMGLLYKFKAQGKENILITKHKLNVLESLKKFKIPQTIFDEVVHMKPHEEKKIHVGKSSIFIDDSFSERLSIHEKTGIPVFDASEAVELL